MTLRSVIPYSLPLNPLTLSFRRACPEELLFRASARDLLLLVVSPFFALLVSSMDRDPGQEHCQDDVKVLSSRIACPENLLFRGSVWGLVQGSCTESHLFSLSFSLILSRSLTKNLDA